MLSGVIFRLVLAVAVLAPVAWAAEPGEEQLILFTRSAIVPKEKTKGVRSAVSEHAEGALLVELKAIAEEMGVTLVVVDVDKQGAPPEVRITPLIAFQNHRGRSIYQGRTNTLDRVRSFVRTSRFVPQGDTLMTWDSIAARYDGRATIWSPIKVSAVTGTQPAGYDDAVFQREAREAILSGFSDTKMRNGITLGRADRGFYMDFYPWRAEDGTLFLSLALYSQFHCKEPVWELKKEPLTGPWKDRKRLFAEAGALMEAAVAERMAEATGGDGFDPVPSRVKTVTWKQLGLDLPPPPEKGAAADIAVDLGRHWTVAPPVESNPPMVAFRFPAPLDAYAGYATRASGSLHMGEGPSFSEATGEFAVDMTSVTMGEDDLDAALQSSSFYHTAKYPTSTFTITSVNGDGTNLAFGSLTPVALHGDFSLRGKTIPITAIMQAEPVLDEQMNVRLWLRGSFTIDITTFGLKSGLDGPDGAGHTVVFDLNFLLQPAAE